MLWSSSTAALELVEQSESLLAGPTEVRPSLFTTCLFFFMHLNKSSHWESVKDSEFSRFSIHCQRWPRRKKAKVNSAVLICITIRWTLLSGSALESSSWVLIHYVQSSVPEFCSRVLFQSSVPFCSWVLLQSSVPEYRSRLLFLNPPPYPTGSWPPTARKPKPAHFDTCPHHRLPET